jgi:23S rRNA pseudouridine1911/1915/1917 synthase
MPKKERQGASICEPHEILVVEPWQQHSRLDALLSDYFQKSRTYFQNLIEEGFVVVNGKREKKSYKPVPGDEIEVQFVVTRALDIAPENIPLDILYEDEELIVVNKAASMVVHPAHGNWSGTFVNALLFHCRNLECSDVIRPGIVHRLDKGTSGVLIAAKTAHMQERLARLFAARRVRKRYLAICLGKPENQTIRASLGRHPVLRKEIAVLEVGGKEAETELEILKSNGVLSLVALLPKTGRTHQLRVHLKHIGHPILGDPLYGRERQNSLFRARRQLLHAETLEFLHPKSGKLMTFIAPIPDDMKEVIEKI